MSIRGVCLFLLLVSSGLSSLSCGRMGERELRLVTGPIGGTWYPLGGAIAELVKKRIPNLSISVGPGGGIANVKAIEEGKADLGFGNVATTIDAIRGRDPFSKKVRNVRHVATLYKQYFQLVVLADSGITSVADLKGKAIIPGTKGTTGELMTRHVLQVYGLTYNDMGKVHHIGYSDGIALMKDGHADLFSPVTAIPASAIIDLASSRRIRLLSLPEDKIKALQQINPGYVRHIIPKGTYPGVDHDIVTFGTYTQLLASAALPEDVVFEITKAVVEGRRDLALVAKEMEGFPVEEMGQEVGVPFHPGAFRYFQGLRTR